MMSAIFSATCKLLDFFVSILMPLCLLVAVCGPVAPAVEPVIGALGWSSVLFSIALSATKFSGLLVFIIAMWGFAQFGLWHL